MDTEIECPICYISYSITIKDGKDNSDYRENCNHYICVDCCKELRIQLNVVDKVLCPICRENWTEWLMTHYSDDDDDDDAQCQMCGVKNNSVGYAGCSHDEHKEFLICDDCDIDGSNYNGWDDE